MSDKVRTFYRIYASFIQKERYTFHTPTRSMKVSIEKLDTWSKKDGDLNVMEALSVLWGFAHVVGDFIEQANGLKVSMTEGNESMTILDGRVIARHTRAEIDEDKEIYAVDAMNDYGSDSFTSNCYFEAVEFAKNFVRGDETASAKMYKLQGERGQVVTCSDGGEWNAELIEAVCEYRSTEDCEHECDVDNDGDEAGTESIDFQADIRDVVCESSEDESSDDSDSDEESDDDSDEPRVKRTCT